MKIELNPEAASSNQLFNIEYDRAGHILNHLARVCSTAINNFESEYQKFAILPAQDGKNDLMHRLDNYRILNEMLEIAETENEKNYILFCAYTGIENVDKVVFRGQMHE